LKASIEETILATSFRLNPCKTKIKLNKWNQEWNHTLWKSQWKIYSQLCITNFD